MRKIIPLITLILIVFGFFPYKWPRDAEALSNAEMLVVHEEFTGSADLNIVKGKLVIPPHLKPFVGTEILELNVDSTGLSMFDPINDNQGNWFLISENQFVISGEVTGVDSSDVGYTSTFQPKFRIDKWSPTRYHANFWTFGVPAFILYFLALFVLIITTIVLFFYNRSRNGGKQ